MRKLHERVRKQQVELVKALRAHVAEHGPDGPLVAKALRLLRHLQSIRDRACDGLAKAQVKGHYRTQHGRKKP